jgi:hypothetical protein
VARLLRGVPPEAPPPQAELRHLPEAPLHQEALRLQVVPVALLVPGLEDMRAPLICLQRLPPPVA